MAKIDEFVLEERDRRAVLELARMYDLEDESDCERLAFVVMTLGMLVADSWDPYHVIGVLQCTVNHIYRLLEEGDE